MRATLALVVKTTERSRVRPAAKRVKGSSGARKLSVGWPGWICDDFRGHTSLTKNVLLFKHLKLHVCTIFESR